MYHPCDSLAHPQQEFGSVRRIDDEPEDGSVARDHGELGEVGMDAPLPQRPAHEPGELVPPDDDGDDRASLPVQLERKAQELRARRLIVPFQH